MAGGRPRLYPEPQKFAEMTEAYFAEATTPNMAGLCFFLGFADKQSFSQYEEYGEEFSLTVKRARLRMEADRHAKLIDKAAFTPGLIFDLKNNHGWKDTTQQELTGPDGGPIKTESRPDMSGLTSEQLAALAAIPG